MDETAILNERVVTGMLTLSKTSVIKQLAARWIALTSAAQKDSLQKTQDAYQAFCATLADMELQGRKLAAVQAANKRELDSYEQKRRQLEADISQANALIEAKKQQLAEARIWRKQQEEYEVLREQITKLPPRHETQQAIDAVKQRMAGTQADIDRQHQLYEVIGKKAAAVRYQLEDLLASFPKDGMAASDAAADAAQPMQVDG